MKTALALRHVAFEDLGVFEAALHEAGYDVRTVDNHHINAGALLAMPCDLLISLGAPIGVNDEALFPFIAEEARLIEAKLRADVPVLGICFGAQLIARVLGSRVRAMPNKEIGWAPVTLTPQGQATLAALGGVPVLHWHGDTFDLPSDCDLLASTSLCENQAFRKGSRVLGLQFHCEVDPARIEHWLVGHAYELGAAGIDIAALRSTTKACGRNAAAAGVALIKEWLSELG